MTHSDTPAGRGAPDHRIRLADPDELTLGELAGIKAGTGVDPLRPPSVGENMAACLWYYARHEGYTYEDCLAVPYSTLSAWIDEQDQEDGRVPTHGVSSGSETPSPGSTSSSSSDSDPETSESAPPQSSSSSTGSAGNDSGSASRQS